MVYYVSLLRNTKDLSSKIRELSIFALILDKFCLQNLITYLKVVRFTLFFIWCSIKKTFESHNNKTRVGRRKKSESVGWSGTHIWGGGLNHLISNHNIQVIMAIILKITFLSYCHVLVAVTCILLWTNSHACSKICVISLCLNIVIIRSRGGSRGGALSESLGIDFYSGFRKNPGIHSYSGFREKTHGGCNSKS